MSARRNCGLGVKWMSCRIGKWPFLIATLVFLAFYTTSHVSTSLDSSINDNKLAGAAQGAEWTVLFRDDFEDGNADGWEVIVAEGPAAGWKVEREGSNHVFSGRGHSLVRLQGVGWSDYRFKARVKLIQGGIHLNYRLRDCIRYFIGFNNRELYLSRTLPCGTHTDLRRRSGYHLLGKWYTIEILGVRSNIKVYIDGILMIDYTDTKPVLSGTIGLEALPGSHVYVDDVEVIGPPPPRSPEGFVWVRTGGPSGGLGYDVRIHPQNKNIMFVTDNPSGVNKSYDAGTTWTQRNKGITTRTGPSRDGIPIFSLTIDPSNPNIVWAGTQDAKGIYKSTDGGETWVKKDNGVTEGNEISFRNFGIHPYNSNIVFAGAEISTGILGIEFPKTKGKIYKTEDGGENWRCVWEGDNLVRFILFDPINPNIMYASTGIFDREAYNDVGVGVLKSTDGGETWRQINNGLKNLYVGFLEMHPMNPQILFAAAGNHSYSEGGGIYKTTDGGASWTRVLPINPHESLRMTVVTISPSDPRVIYAGDGESGFYRSDDGGKSWHRFFKIGGGYGPPGIRAGIPISAVVDPNDPMTVFVNNYNGGVFKSTDGGRTWVNSSKGYTGAHLHHIAIDAGNPAIVYTIGRSGPFRSYNGGEDWSGIAFPPANKPEWYAVALNPANRQEVLISDEFSGTIYKSTDGGTSWRIVFKHFGAGVGDPQERRHGFKAIAYAPSNPSIVYAGMSKCRRTIDGDFPPRPSFGMYKSTDGGKTWVEINNGLKTSLININSIAVHPTNPDIVYIGTWKDGVFKTTNGGRSWEAKNNGLVSADVRSLAIDPQNPEVVYAGLGEGAGIFKTTNGGELWEAINSGLNIMCPSYLLSVGQVQQGMSLERPPKGSVGADYYSVPWTSVWSIVIDPTNPQTIYAADYSNGVYMSTNGGASWLPINDGLSTKAVSALAISSNGRILYAATVGGGVFRLTLP